MPESLLGETPYRPGTSMLNKCVQQNETETTSGLIHRTLEVHLLKQVSTLEPLEIGHTFKTTAITWGEGSDTGGETLVGKHGNRLNKRGWR